MGENAAPARALTARPVPFSDATVADIATASTQYSGAMFPAPAATAACSAHKRGLVRAQARQGEPAARGAR
jgi:hypothetical protein